MSDVVAPWLLVHSYLLEPYSIVRKRTRPQQFIYFQLVYWNQLPFSVSINIFCVPIRIFYSSVESRCSRVRRGPTVRSGLYELLLATNSTSTVSILLPPRYIWYDDDRIVTTDSSRHHNTHLLVIHSYSVTSRHHIITYHHLHNHNHDPYSKTWRRFCFSV